MKNGIVILGHGSRTQEANSVFREIVDMIKANREYNLVQMASMELAKPSLAQSVAKLVEEGVKKVVVAPLFLFPGVHIQKDIPALLQREKEKYPEVEFVLGRNIGAHRKLAEIMLERINEVACG